MKFIPAHKPAAKMQGMHPNGQDSNSQSSIYKFGFLFTTPPSPTDKLNTIMQDSPKEVQWGVTCHMTTYASKNAYL